jgi:uncharacterized protein (DUF58 family)
MSNGITAELTELIALKRYAQKIPVKLDKSAFRDGNYYSKLRGRGMDFAEVRHYQAGDEIRHMEWRVTARTGSPHIKLYQEERERPVVLIVDFNASMFFGTRIALKSVVACRLAAIIAWTSVQQGDRVGGFFYSGFRHDELIPKARERGALPLLGLLCEYSRMNHQESFSARSLSDVLVRLRRVAKPGSVLIFLSDFYHMDKDSEQHLARLRSHNDILAYHIGDPLEFAPPHPSQYAVTDGKETLVLDTTLKSMQQTYKNYGEQQLAHLQTRFKRLKIPCVPVVANMNLPGLVRQTFLRSTHGR